MPLDPRAAPLAPAESVKTGLTPVSDLLAARRVPSQVNFPSAAYVKPVMGAVLRRLLALAAVALTATSGVNGSERRESVRDAFVDHDPGARRWTIGNATIELSIVIGLRGE